MSEIGNIPENNTLVTDKVFIYPSIPHKTGLKALKNAWEKRTKGLSYEKINQYGEICAQKQLS